MTFFLQLTKIPFPKLFIFEINKIISIISSKSIKQISVDAKRAFKVYTLFVKRITHL